MKSIALLMVVTVLPLPAQPQAGGGDSREIERLEEELERALALSDVQALERLWHDDLVFIGTNGRQFTKAERLAGLAAEPTPQRMAAVEANTNDEVVVDIEGDTAIVTVTSTWTFPPSATVRSQRYHALHVWMRANGAWSLRAAQVARIAE
jgi:uncharacterized protein (TIGR02246 family)